MPVTLPRRRYGSFTKEYRTKIAAWLRAHPGPQRKTEVARAAGIPVGSLPRVVKCAMFRDLGGGMIELAANASEIDQELARTKYSAETLTKVRYAVYCELSVMEPQTVPMLKYHLKLEKDLIELALTWHKFRETEKGWVRVPTPICN